MCPEYLASQSDLCMQVVHQQHKVVADCRRGVCSVSWSAWRLNETELGKMPAGMALLSFRASLHDS